MTPRTIRKAAKNSAENSPQLLAWIKEYPKKFEYYKGELFFDAREILEGLRIAPTRYAPTLSVRSDGRYRYERVENYNLIWLMRNKDQELKTQTNMNHLNHQQFGLKIDGCSLDEWLEMISRKNDSIKFVHLFGQRMELQKTRRCNNIKMP